MSQPTWLYVVTLIREKYSDAKQIEATIRRFFLPNHGFFIAGNRATKAEMKQAEIFMTTQVFPFLSEEEWTVSLEQALIKAGLSNAQKRSSRCYGKKFIFHVKNNGWLSSVEPPKHPTIKDSFFKRRSPDPVVDKSCSHQSTPKVHKQPRISLSFRAEDYLTVYKTRFPDATDAELLQIIKQELERIQKEQEDCLRFFAYREKDPLSKASQQNWLMQMARLYGWRFSQSQDLAEVGLTKIIPVVPVQVLWEDCDTDNINDYFIAKGKAEQKAKKAANQTIEFLKSFFRNYGYRYKTSSKVFYIEALTNAAKFLYESITDDTQFSNYQDIPVICKLNIFRQKLPKDPQTIQTLPVTWEEAVLILKELKKRVDNPFYYFTNGSGKMESQKVDKPQIARDMQRFLAFALLIIIPPIRCRTLAELELGRTISCGLSQDSGFKNKENLVDPSLAKYYYHMMPDDYKTGKSHGEYFVQLPNKNLGDGTYFYDYLDKWFFSGYRESLLLHQQTHHRMFVKFNKSRKSLPGDPMNPNNYADMIYKITEQFAGVSIGPHAFRSIYRTHLINSGATLQELASAAFFMQHSEEMAAKSYTIQTLKEKSDPIFDLIARSEI